MLENLENITPESCHEAFKEHWETEDITLILTTKESKESDKEELAKLYKQSQQQEIKALAAKETIAFGYTEFGDKGEVAVIVENCTEWNGTLRS